MNIIKNSWRKLTNLLADLRERLRREGWRQTGRWLVTTLLSLPYRRMEYIVFTRSLSEPLPTADPRLPVTLRVATPADLALFEGLVSPSELAHFRRRLTQGRYCFLALDPDDTKLAAYCWASTQVTFEVDNIEIRLQPGDAYVDDAYTVPAYRRQGIQTAVHLYRLAHMKGLGCQRAILIVEDKNIASQHLVRKLGYQEADHLSFRRILWKRTYHYHAGKF